MTRRWRIVLVATVATLGVTGAVLDLIQNGVVGESVAFFLTGLVFVTVSGVLVIRVPDNRVSWALLLASTGFVLTGAGTIMPQPIGDLVIGSALFVLALPSLGVLVPLLFPTGAPTSHRWRWVAWVAVAGVAFFLVGGMISFMAEGVDFAAEVTCTSTGTCMQIGGLGFLLLGVVAAIISLITRWVRALGVERLQLRWLLPSFFIFGIGVLAEFGGFQGSLVANVFLPIGALLIPISIGIAVTRYRLYEIDRVVSRTVSYSLVVAVLALVFFGVVTAFTTLLPEMSDLAVAASTLAVAALFNPTRRRIQHWVDRRFNRSRYDAEKVMDGFASSLRDRVDPDVVLDGWVGVVAETMQPRTVGVWVR